MPRIRRSIGGTIWKRDVQTTKRAVEKANEAAQKILILLEKTPNMPVKGALAIYLTAITTNLTEILTSLDRIVKTAEAYIEPDEVWEEALDDIEE